jgi:5-methylcytosine-specific restriction endonuclease McrA
MNGRASLDHVIPKALNGADRLGNLVAAHRGCNHRKGSHPPTGCTLVWLLAVNNRLGVGPMRW